MSINGNSKRVLIIQKRDLIPGCYFGEIGQVIPPGPYALVPMLLTALIDGRAGEHVPLITSAEVECMPGETVTFDGVYV